MTTSVSNKKKILCIFDKENGFPAFMKIMKKEDYFVYNFSDPLEAMSNIYNEPPDLVLLSTEVPKWEEFVGQIKNDSLYKHLPVILIIPKNLKKNLLSLLEFPFDDFLYSNDDPDELLLRIRIRETYTNRYLDANPLTHLPGNFSIMNAIQSFIDSKIEFGLGYVDIDNFKAFNDRYGFAQGDDMIRMTARILTNVVRRICPKVGFVGHVGGDDFVFIVTPVHIEESCRQILQNFDLVSATLSNDEDRLRGFIETEDRQGNLRRFPLPTLSIAAIDSTLTKINHTGEAAAIAGEIKKEVKKKTGSNYLINRRK